MVSFFAPRPGVKQDEEPLASDVDDAFNGMPRSWGLSTKQRSQQPNC
jgi:hypothetical protein